MQFYCRFYLRIIQLSNTVYYRNMGSFDSQNIGTIDRKYICYICSLVLCDPVQLGCGHRYCETCVNVQER